MLHKRRDHGAQNDISAIDGMWSKQIANNVILVKHYVKIVPWDNCPAVSPSTLLLDGRTPAASKNLFGLPTVLLTCRSPGIAFLVHLTDEMVLHVDGLRSVVRHVHVEII